MREESRPERYSYDDSISDRKDSKDNGFWNCDISDGDVSDNIILNDVGMEEPEAVTGSNDDKAIGE